MPHPPFLGGWSAEDVVKVVLDEDVEVESPSIEDVLPAKVKISLFEFCMKITLCSFPTDKA